MNKLAYILELIWLGLAVVCLGLGVYTTATSGISISYMFFILTALALGMYILRRKRRLNMEK